MKTAPPVWDDEQSEPEISVTQLAKAHASLVGDDGGDREVVGERFGKYLIVGELAVGGMAEILLAVQRGIEGFTKVVVLKRVLSHLSESPDFIRMFVDEARLAARLEHPNIVRTYEFGEVKGQYFTAMEYLPGEDLAKVLNTLSISRQRMPLHVAATVVSQLCAGLHCAHDLTDTAGRPLNLVHRDVSPANIILTYNGEVKIIDFGVAKTNTNAQTLSGTIKGKLSYMSPEQLLSRGIDRRSDVFSAGVVLWEVLVGRPLFLRDNEAATLYAIMNDPIPPPSRYRPEVPPELDQIVARALARTPADRYESAEELGAALDAFVAERNQHFDSKVLARLVEELFGMTRAEAKRCIAQTRSLQRNISLVMKMRSEVRSDLADTLDSLAVGADPSQAAALPAIEERAGKLPWVIGLVVLAALGLGVGILLRGGGESPKATAATPTAQVVKASLKIESQPPGAAISIDGEPTGLKTPATLSGLAAREVKVRLDLDGHPPRIDRLTLEAGQTVAKTYELASKPTGRLVLARLPSGATVVVDDVEYEAGQVIDVPAGLHDVKIVHGGRTLVSTSISTRDGDQTYTLVENKLVAQ